MRSVGLDVFTIFTQKDTWYFDGKKKLVKFVDVMTKILADLKAKILRQSYLLKILSISNDTLMKISKEVFATVLSLVCKKKRKFIICAWPLCSSTVLFVKICMDGTQ